MGLYCFFLISWYNNEYSVTTGDSCLEQVVRGFENRSNRFHKSQISPYSTCRHILPDNTEEMKNVLDEVSTAFALVPIRTLINWGIPRRERSPSPSRQSGSRRSSPVPTPSVPQPRTTAFPDNSTADEFETPLYAGDIFRENGIYKLECALPLFHQTYVRTF